jgi:hypothetical protein
VDDLLQWMNAYQRVYAISARGHYLAAARKARWNYVLGVPSVAISAIVGASIFSTLESNPQVGWKIAAGLLSLAVAVFGSLQTFFRFADSAERHLDAGRKYSALRRRLELLQLKYRDSDKAKRSEALKDIEQFNEALSQTAEQSPAIPDSCWDQASLEEPQQNPKEISKAAVA